MADFEGLMGSLSCGEPARLIPVVADGSREQRVTSALLATFTVVPAFAYSMLEEVGCPTHKRARIRCFTEIAFKPNGAGKRPRPDGLITVISGSKCWSAIVEAKVGAAELRKEQIEEYLDLAKTMGIDAVITISNQFAALPTHHPISVAKQKLRTTELYHFSWLSLVSKALLLSEGKSITDPEQAFVLQELVRYLQHSSSGVTSLTRLGSSWKDVCGEVQQGMGLRKTAPVAETVGSWHQLVRYLAIQLSTAVGKPVQLYLGRKHAADPNQRLEDEVATFCRSNTLRAEFEVPDAASRLNFSADFTRRTINLSMKLDAPKDRARPTAAINWLSRQLKQLEDSDLAVWAHWPRRTPTTMASLRDVLQDPKVLVPNNTSDIPSGFEIVRVIDLAGRFRGTKTFVEEAERAVPQFYADVGQRLVRWVAPPPQIKRTSEQQDERLPGIPEFSPAEKPVHEMGIRNEGSESHELNEEEQSD